MSLVVDANVLLAQAIAVPYSAAARRRFRDWVEAGTLLVAPALWEYQATSALRRLLSLEELTSEQASRALDRIYSLGVDSVPPTAQLQRSALSWAQRLGRSKAYDTVYLAVAERLEAPFWTADLRLVRNARALGADWIHDATAPENEPPDQASLESEE